MKSDVTLLIAPLSFLVVVFASGCDREFNLYDSYGHGYDITCKELDQSNLDPLRNITVTNEIKLTIQNSSLQNVTSSIFRRVEGIRYLYLENCTFTFSSTEAIFGALERLEYLSITNTEFAIKKNSFQGLKRLNDLILSGNGLHTFPKDCFKDLTVLNHLQVTQNLLKDIDNIPFCELTNLRVLNLSSNAIETLSSEYLICGNGDDGSIDFSLNDQMQSIQPNNFSTVDAFSSDLSELDLSFNKLKSLGYYLNSFRHIRKLNLQFNQLTKIKSSNFKNLNTSEEIYLNNNQIRSIDSSTFTGKDNLYQLDLSHNKLDQLVLDELPTLKCLNLGYNNLTEHCLKTLKCSSLETLLLNNNNLSNIEARIFVKFSNLVTLDLSNNHVILNDGSFTNLSQLNVLKISNNAIKDLPGSVFSSLKELETLDLSNNKLSSLSDCKIFKNLEDLVFLNLSHNYLNNLEYCLLESNRDLRVLDVEDNRLLSIQYEMILSHLPLISVLNIRSNLLSCENLADIITFLKERRVNYTTRQAFDIDKENIAGIYCTSDRGLSLPNSQGYSDSGGTNYLLSFSIVLVSICFAIVTGVFVFKIYIFIKRRKYRADEFELINE